MKTNKVPFAHLIGKLLGGYEIEGSDLLAGDHVSGQICHSAWKIYLDSNNDKPIFVYINIYIKLNYIVLIAFKPIQYLFIINYNKIEVLII